MKPATPLPWSVFGNAGHIIGNRLEDANRLNVVHGQWTHNTSHDNAAYIVHAANAYPRLVEALRSAIRVADGWHDDDRGGRAPDLEEERSLLRALGESDA